MVVQHNLTAMNSNRMLGVTTSAQAKSTEKLSSGYKINRAADDAAGLSISEKMRKQIRGLTQASSNAQDGISAVQTAEGALNEVQDMLQRMNELAVQSANGTNSSTDRQAIQDEIDQLTTEIDRVSETTKFNETYLLKGDGTAASTLAKASGALAGKVTIPASLTDDQETAIAAISGKTYTATYTAAVDEVAEARTFTAKTGSTDGTKLTGVAGTIKEDGYLTVKDGAWVDDNGTTYTDAQATTKFGVTFTYDGANSVANLTNGSTLQLVKAVAAADASTVWSDGTKTYSSTDALNRVLADTGITVDAVTESGSFTIKTSSINGNLDFNLHVGADSDDTNKIGVNIEHMSSAGLGVFGLDVTTENSATAAIDTIADAIQKVSEQRSALGAIQNRLEHTIKNLDNVVENTTSAESQIRDTDMATEMVRYSNNNILAQAGQSMLAQANQSNQGVLSLLG